MSFSGRVLAVSLLLVPFLPLGGCGSAGREVTPGITFYERETTSSTAAESEWRGSWMEVPLYVSRDPEEKQRWIENHRLIAIEQAMESYRSPSEARVHPLYGDPARGGVDTLGAFLWRFARRDVSVCTDRDVLPGDSINPPRRICARRESETRESLSPGSLQRTVLTVGGNAALLVHEEHAMGYEGLRGYILRCPASRGRPDCR